VDVIRRDAAGKATVVAVNMDDLLKGKNGIADLTLQPNDILYIQSRSHPQSIGSVLASISGLAGVVALTRY